MDIKKILLAAGVIGFAALAFAKSKKAIKDSLGPNMANMIHSDIAPGNIWVGEQIKVNYNDVILTNVTKHPGCTANTAIILDPSVVPFTVMASSPFKGNDAAFNCKLSAGAEYRIATVSDNNYMRVYSDVTTWNGESYPVMGTNIDFMGGVDARDWQRVQDSFAFNIVSVTTIAIEEKKLHNTESVQMGLF